MRTSGVIKGHNQLSYVQAKEEGKDVQTDLDGSVAGADDGKDQDLARDVVQAADINRRDLEVPLNVPLLQIRPETDPQICVEYVLTNYVTR